LPKGEYTERAIRNAPQGTIGEENALASYDEAVRVCKAKVEKIIQECRRLNCKFSDPDFDIERDFDRGRPSNCLDKLVFHAKDKVLAPKSVKRIGDIFDDPKFFTSGPTPNNVRQGSLGNCWLMAALCAVGNMPDLIEKVCVARDEVVGVYGFAFFRDGEWRAEVIDDKLYLKHPDFNRKKSGLPGKPERNKQRQITEEEKYRKMYQVFFFQILDTTTMLTSTAKFRITLFRKQISQPQLLFQVFAHCVTSVNLAFGHVKLTSYGKSWIPLLCTALTQVS
jgi:hypothetical protein